MKPDRHSDAVAAYINSLPPERRKDIERLRKVILSNLPPGYEEVVNKNMIVYQVPLELYSDTYNGQPLWYVALSAEAKKMSLHLMPIYGSESFMRLLKDGFKTGGKKPDIGKACVRFSSAADLPLDVVGEIVAAVPVERWIEIAKSARRA